MTVYIKMFQVNVPIYCSANTKRAPFLLWIHLLDRIFIIRAIYSVIQIVGWVRRSLLWCSIRNTMIMVKTFLNPLLHIFVCLRICDQCWSRSTCLSMPSDQHLHWLHLGKKKVMHQKANSTGPDQTAQMCQLIWIYKLFVLTIKVYLWSKGFWMV
jgi:hypothetical protein